MTTEIRDRELEELVEGTHNVLHRSEEIIQQTEKLLKQSQELMRDFNFLQRSRDSRKQAPRQLK